MPWIQIKVSNTGKTPALNIKMTYGLTWRQRNDSKQLPSLDTAKFQAKTILGPETAYLVNIQGHSSIPDSVFLSIVRGRRDFVVYGAVQYEDIFGGRDTIKFAFVYTGQKDYAIYRTHNDQHYGIEPFVRYGRQGDIR